jgi:hypothetical protein
MLPAAWTGRAMPSKPARKIASAIGALNERWNRAVWMAML